MTRLPLKGAPRKNGLNRSFNSAQLDGITQKLPLWFITLTSTDGLNANRLSGAIFAHGDKPSTNDFAQIFSYKLVVRFLSALGACLALHGRRIHSKCRSNFGVSESKIIFGVKALYYFLLLISHC
ncbi:MAG: hypothetical protein ACJAUP_001223 [Cellvibrionaceae bacterium]|jgi:hypothetical protein